MWDDPVKNYALVLAIVVGTAISAHFGFQLSQAGTLFTPPYVAFAATIIFACYAAARAYFDGDLRSLLRIRAGDLSRGFLGVLLLFGLAYGFNRLAMTPGTARESWMARLYLQFGHPFMLRNQQPQIAAALLVAAISEELVWRGLVPRLLEQRFGTSRAWVVAAVLYAVALVPTAWALRDPVAGLNPVLPLGGLVAGLTWGWMAQRFGRLFPSVLSHFAFCWAVIIVFPLWGV